MVWLPARDGEGVPLDPVDDLVTYHAPPAPVDDVVHGARRFADDFAARSCGESLTLSAKSRADLLALLALLFARVAHNGVSLGDSLEPRLHLCPWKEDRAGRRVLGGVTWGRVVLRKVDWEMLELREVKTVEPDHRGSDTVVSVILQDSAQGVIRLGYDRQLTW